MAGALGGKIGDGLTLAGIGRGLGQQSGDGGGDDDDEDGKVDGAALASVIFRPLIVLEKAHHSMTPESWQLLRALLTAAAKATSSSGARSTVAAAGWPPD